MANKQVLKKQASERRRMRVRAKISGTAERPRVSVFRGARDMYVQLIDDTTGTTILATKLSSIKKDGKPVEKAKEIGLLLAKQAIEKGIKTVVIDRNRFQYHGRVKAVAEGLREGGLTL
ncbi:50S ribosomal protein L18 [Candidatus Falkowbacteria bacterium CG10_big_fil_rev_8_21_14_0_10_39_11]|uniref:Large ribosomal subunit protein uL18 n=1 Tax=Candidatus Falkowbacteria bacterium CG10_big_fil_rev_8_21_14_0_10_39_11 TaxID=1974565 RepID=A0A2H0V3R1_9BACT|nr:MAG: 50S ribosomal protein L18 [Candidatus Falkowbacteria bacterium CG10_big_fil_rev_8_21_14_0_10_39_11]